MAYSASAVLTHKGGPNYELVITETEAGTATEATIDNLPLIGRILRQSCTKSSGDATTVAPMLVTSSGSSAAVHIVCQASAASDQVNIFDPSVQYSTANGTLYHRTVCDSGSNNAVVTVYLLKASW